MWDDLFKGRKWRVAEELTGKAADPAQPGVVVSFDRGWFSMDAPGAYRSPLSTNLGRRGVILAETDPDGAVDLPGPRIAVGVHALKKARLEYNAVW
jgi:hypothetical protein